MCGGGGGSDYKPPPPPAPPAAAPKPMVSPEDSKVTGSTENAGGFYKRRGKDALKIDLGVSNGGAASGLNIPV